MKKNRIRLTESQLHRVIKESVNKILYEIKFGGESLHGNNPEDWLKINKYRQQYINDFPYEVDPLYTQSPEEDEYYHNIRQDIRNQANYDSFKQPSNLP